MFSSPKNNYPYPHQPPQRGFKASSIQEDEDDEDDCDPCECPEKMPDKDKELWDVQFCRWWGYKWLKDRENAMKEKMTKDFEKY